MTPTEPIQVLPGQETLFVESVGAVRSTDPHTSQAAAAAISGRTEHRIMEVFLVGGMTDDELVAVLRNEHGPTVKSARSRLTRAGHLIDSGRARPSARGRAQTVWRLA